jgi:RimJ/RimL family protein N-acetyltransferase
MSGLAPVIRLDGVPVLETQRLILRAPEPADFEPYARYFESPRARFTGGPLTRELAFRSFGHMVGHWIIRGFGFFVTCLREGAQPIGMVGCHFPEGWPEREIGWAMWDPQWEGRGLAHEAALKVREFAYHTLNWPTAISLIDPQNARSEALAKAMGCTPDGSFRHERFGESRIWRHPAPEALT